MRLLATVLVTSLLSASPVLACAKPMDEVGAISIALSAVEVYEARQEVKRVRGYEGMEVRVEAVEHDADQYAVTITLGPRNRLHQTQDAVFVVYVTRCVPTLTTVQTVKYLPGQ